MGGSKSDYLDHRERLRQRFIDHGLEAFADYEALELLLTLFIPRRDVKPTAKRLVGRFGGVRGALDASIKELSGVEGLGEGSAVKIKVMRALIDRYLQEKVRTEAHSEGVEAIRDYCRTRLGPLKIETFRVFYLDTALKVLGDEELERGTINRAAIFPRQVIDAAMRNGAAYLVLAHNHPNENPEPSDHDRTITRAISLAGANLDIQVLDHLIVTRGEIYSFREAGLL